MLIILDHFSQFMILAVWTTEKSNSSLGLNAGGVHSGSSQGLHQYQNIYGCRGDTQLLHPQSVPPIPGGFSAAVHQASVYSTLPRNHSSSSNYSNDHNGFYRGFQYRNAPAQSLTSQQGQTYQNYSQIGAKSTPSLRNAVLQEHQLPQKCFGDSTDENARSSNSTPASGPSKPASELHQQQSIYQPIPIPTLSPARSTPNLGSSGGIKSFTPRQDPQQNVQGSIPHLSMVSSSQQAVNTFGTSYPHSQQSQAKLYAQFGSSSCLTQQQSLVSLQKLQPNDKSFAEPSRYPSTPNLQKSESSNPLPGSTPPENSEENSSDSHNFELGINSGSTNNLQNNSTTGAMSGSNDSTTAATPNCIGGNWNSLDNHSSLSNNNNNSAPCRDPSSLKQIRYGPGHEKYPSWPIPVSSAQQIDPAGETHPVKLVVGTGSTRSKSWTEQTDYPKEKTPSYARPYMKRVNPSYTQQLKTVMEKCERIPADAFASQVDPQMLNSHQLGARGTPMHHQIPMNGGMQKNSEGGILPPPLLYRDLMNNPQYNLHHHQNMMQYYQTPISGHKQTGGGGNEKDYMIPSPPERNLPEKEMSKPLTQEDLELYTKKYEELITQYPQSEGYHSYISSDSSSYISSGTPFLDQLRRESENNQQFWSGDKSLSIAALSGICDPNDPLFGLIGGQLASAGVSGRESVTTVVTNSSSNSSGTETLKWHGSTSDISLASGVSGLSALKHNSHFSSSRKNGSGVNKGWTNEQQNIAHSSRLSTPQKQHAATPDSMSNQNGVSSLRSKLEHLKGSASVHKWQSGTQDAMDMASNNKKNGVNSSENGNNPPNLKKFPLNTYTRPNTLGVDNKNHSQNGNGASNSNHSGNTSSATSTPEKMAKLLQTFNAENSKSVHGSKSLSHSLSSPVIDTSKPPSVAERIMELEQQSHQRATSPSTSGASSPKMGQGQSHDNLPYISSTFMKSSSLNNLPNSPSVYVEEQNNSSQAQPQQNEWMSPQQGSRQSNPAPARGFVQSLSSTNVSKTASDSSNNNAISYSYLDPDKKHKVADMTLKAIQKKALLSYYERHKGKCANTSSASSVSSSEGNPSPPDAGPEKDNCFNGKSSRLMLSLPKEHSPASSLIDPQQIPSNLLTSDNNMRNGGGSNPSTTQSSPTLSGLSNRPYRAISVSSAVSSSSSSSRGSSASNSKVSSHSPHQQLHGANNNNSPKNIQSPVSENSNALSEEVMKQAEKSDSGRHTTPNSASLDTEPTDIYPTADSARLAYMSKYLPHLVNRDGTTTTTQAWQNNNNAKLPQGGSSASNGSPVTQEPTPIPPERPPKKPHLRNLAQQVQEDSKDSKPPPPLPRAPVRPPTLLNNGVSKPNQSTTPTGPPPVPSKPSVSSSSGTTGFTRSPSPDDLPLPPPPPEDMEVLLNDEPLPPPPTVSEVDVLFGSRTRSVTGLSSCLHKDSYMAQRKERTLGYEGRYRRTLSPSGLGSNNNISKSSLESPSPGAPDSVGSTRSMTNLGGVGTGKLDTSLSPAAWEKIHNIRAPSTTVIFTSNELAKGAGSPPSSTAGSSTSGSPQPPLSQPLFHRSISCDSNIFNNKTGASQSSIPPPVAQVAPLRGSNSIHINNGIDTSIEKLSQMSLRNEVIPLSPSSSVSTSPLHSSMTCDTKIASTPERENAMMAAEHHSEKDDRLFREPLSQHQDKSKPELGDHKEQTNSRTGHSATLPSVIVPPLQYEKYEKDIKNGGQAGSFQHHQLEANPVLKKSEMSLRVNCTSVVTLQSEIFNGTGRSQNGFVEGESSCDAGMNSDGWSTSKQFNNNSAVNASNSTASFYTGRQKTQEELECEELSRDIAKMLPQGDKLQTLLVPLPDHKTTADYMEGLFHLELKLQPDTPERRGSLGTTAAITVEKLLTEKCQIQSSPDDFNSEHQASLSPQETLSHTQKTGMVTALKDTMEQSHPQCTALSRSPEFSHSPNGTLRSQSYEASPNSAFSPVVNTKKGEMNESGEKTTPASYRRCNGHAPLPADSAYFTTSESKAKFLTQYNQDIKNESKDFSGTDGEGLDKQKEELVSRISRKLEILRTEQLLLREEIQSNEQLGHMVVDRVKQTAKRNEFDKFKLHVEEIEKITSLLLGISGRLARAENALMGLSDPPNPQEKKILESKRDKLREQLDEAKVLKENIDRRSAQVSSFLQKYLTTEEYADYDHFVKMKAKLIIDAREIDDKIKLGEEQLGALKDALNTSLPFTPNTSAS